MFLFFTIIFKNGKRGWLAQFHLLICCSPRLHTVAYDSKLPLTSMAILKGIIHTTLKLCLFPFLMIDEEKNPMLVHVALRQQFPGLLPVRNVGDFVFSLKKKTPANLDLCRNNHIDEVLFPLWVNYPFKYPSSSASLHFSSSPFPTPPPTTASSLHTISPSLHFDSHTHTQTHWEKTTHSITS